MAATQSFQVGSYNYVVVVNSPAQAFPTLSCGTHVGYDTVNVFPREQSGRQGENSISGGNGTVPDFCINQTSIATGTVLATIRYKNPS